jgi:hypothetical protein
MEWRRVPGEEPFIAAVLGAAQVQDRARQDAYERLIARAPAHSPQAVKRSSRRNEPGPQARYNLTGYEMLVFDGLVRRGMSKDAAAAAIVRSRRPASVEGAR